MNKNHFLSLFFISLFCVLNSNSLYAQNHKGIGFQGVIKLPNGELPTRAGLTVNARILSPNNCILREEQFSGVNISNGYINIAIGTGTTGGYNPSLSLKQVMNNSTVMNSLTCLNLDGTVNSNVTSFDPSETDGSRKFRLSVMIDSTPVVADFNMRSMAYAINSESLNGKTESNFLQTSSEITQSKAETWFASTVMSQLLAGTYVSSAATNVTGVVAIANGGTGATTASAARTNLGLGPLATMNPTGTADSTTFLRGDGQWVANASNVTSVAGKTGAVTLQASDVTNFNTAVDGRINAQKGQVDGLASLNSSGKVPSTQLLISALDNQHNIVKKALMMLSSFL